MPLFVKIARTGHGSYIEPFDGVTSAIEGELTDSLSDPQVGDELVLTVVEMTQEEFESLPEFEGH